MKIEKLTKNQYGIVTDYHINYQSYADVLADRGKIESNERRRKSFFEAGNDGNDWLWAGLSSGKRFLEMLSVESRSDVIRSQILSTAEACYQQLKVPNLDNITALSKMNRRRRTRSDFGNAVDIHRVYQGQYDRAWDRTVRVETQTRVRRATVYIAIGGTANKNAVHSVWRAATARRICEALQAAGYTVEIVVGATARDVYPQHVSGVSDVTCVHTTYTAKSYTMPLDASRLAIQCLLGWHRTINFMARCCNDLGIRTNNSMGFTVVDRIAPEYEDRRKAGELVVDLTPDIYSPNVAQTVLNSAISKLESHAR